jgi:hypothetical protein
MTVGSRSRARVAERSTCAARDSAIIASRRCGTTRTALPQIMDRPDATCRTPTFDLSGRTYGVHLNCPIAVSSIISWRQLRSMRSANHERRPDAAPAPGNSQPTKATDISAIQTASPRTSAVYDGTEPTAAVPTISAAVHHHDGVGNPCLGRPYRP